MVLLLVLVVAVKLSAEWVRWIRFGDERTELLALRERILDAGVAVVRTEARSDTLRRAIRVRDRELATTDARLRRSAARLRAGEWSRGMYVAYRRDVLRYNAAVEGRNRKFSDYQRLRTSNDSAWTRYTRLADSIRTLAARVGDPYYPVPLPIEAAAERGLIRVDP